VKDDNVTLISPYFRVINNSSSDEIYLQHVKIRYYFTLDSSDSEETMNYEIYYAGKSNIDGTGAVEDIKPNLKLPKWIYRLIWQTITLRLDLTKVAEP